MAYNKANLIRVGGGTGTLKPYAQWIYAEVGTATTALDAEQYFIDESPAGENRINVGDIVYLHGSNGVEAQRALAAHRVTLNAITGKFQIGETIVDQAVAPNTGIVVGVDYDNLYVYYEPSGDGAETNSGVMTTTDVTGNTTGATGTINSADGRLEATPYFGGSVGDLL